MTNWTTEQNAFFEALTSSNDSLCLNAVAGSGKTTTLVAGVKFLRGSILALAFNKKIQLTLEAEINDARVTTKTMNGLGHGAVKNFFGGGRIKLNKDKVAQLARNYLNEPEHEHLWEFWSPITTLVARAKSHGLVPHKTPGRWTALIEDTSDDWYQLGAHYGLDVTSEVIDAARAILRESNTLAWNGEIDFDDQIYISACWPCTFDQYANVIIDEAQDLSAIQHVMLQKTLADGGRLIAVGDPNQAIYGFRGAMSDSIELLMKNFDLREMGLTVSFRCAKRIIEEAQTLVPRIQAFADSPQGSVNALDAYGAATFSDGDVILCRNNGPLIRMAYRLISEGKGVYVAGRDIGAGLTSLIKQLLGKELNGTLEELDEKLDTWERGEIRKAETKAHYSKLQIIEDKVESLRSVIEFSGALTPKELIERINDLFGKQSAPITLSSIHRSKGLEWPSVYWLDKEKLCPSVWAIRAYEEDPDRFEWMIQEEANICYVATTRAQQALTYIDGDGYEKGA